MIFLTINKTAPLLLSPSVASVASEGRKVLTSLPSERLFFKNDLFGTFGTFLCICGPRATPLHRFSFKTNEKTSIQTETKLDQNFVRKRFHLGGPERKSEKKVNAVKNDVKIFSSLLIKFDDALASENFCPSQTRHKPFWRNPDPGAKILHFLKNRH